VARTYGQEVAPGIYRLGSHWVNWYLIEDGGRFTVVDSGIPGYFDQLPETLLQVGASPGKVEALVLTHYHTDHLGCAERIRSEYNVPVFVPAGEKNQVLGVDKGGKLKGLGSSLWHLNLWKFTLHIAGQGGLSKPANVKEVTTYGDGEVIDVPGKPLSVATPGHSPDHHSLVFEGKDTLVAGDAVATLHVGNGKQGPMIHPFNEDFDTAKRSLDVLEKQTVTNLLPGHGDPWKGEIAEFVHLARERGR
jgi:glyoxylase-like metal-dependent hydrolase (beta-lactamase superfamily II)